MVTLRPNCERPKSEAPTIGWRDGGRIGRGHGGPESAVRRERELELAQIRVGDAVKIQARQRDRHVVLDVPGVRAAEDRGHLLLRHRIAAERRVVALPPVVVLARPPGVVVDDARVAGHLVLRPVFRETVRLANPRRPAGARVLNRLEVCAAHRRVRGLQDGSVHPAQTRSRAPARAVQRRRKASSPYERFSSAVECYRFTSWTRSKYRLFSLQMYSSSSVSA